MRRERALGDIYRIHIESIMNSIRLYLGMKLQGINSLFKEIIIMLVHPSLP